MKENKKNQVKQTMAQINHQIEERERQGQEKVSLESITYYQELEFGNSHLQDRNVYVTKLTVGEGKEREEVYEIYDENAQLIASVDRQGKIHFTAEYIEALRQIDENYVAMLELDDVDFELPKELGENDLSLQKVEIEEAERQPEKEEKEKGSSEDTLKDIEEVTGAKDIESYAEIEPDKTKVFDKVTNKQEINPNAKVTQTETLADMIPEIKQKGFVKVGVVYSDKTKTNQGKFTFVGITGDGQIQQIESLETIAGASNRSKNYIH